MKNFFGMAYAGISLTVLATGLASPALAQDNRDGAASGDIIVTARRVEERLQDVPISISVVSQQEISDRNITSPNELANYVPSLGTDQRYGGDTITFTIRGFYQEAASSPTVGVYFADAVAPRGNSVTNTPSGDGVNAGNMFDLQNVQVLKGPQGTLFGRNTTGGAILLVPQKPTDKLEGYVEASAGNYNLWRVQAVLNAPLSDTIRVRLGVDRQKRDGWQYNISGIGPDRMGSSDYWALRGSIVADLTPDLENYTVVSYANSDPVPVVNSIVDCNEGPTSATGIQAFSQAFGFCRAQLARAQAGGFYSVQNSMPNPRQQMKQWQVVNTTTWHASDSLTIKNIAAYAEFTANFRSSIFGDNYVVNPASVPAGPLQAVWQGIASKYPGSRLIFAMSSNGPQGPSSSQSTFSEELQFQGKVGKLQWQAGLYFEASNPIGDSGSEGLGLAACSDLTSFTPVCGDLYREYIATLTDLGDGALDGQLKVSPTTSFPVLALVPPVAGLSSAVTQLRYRDYGIYAQGTYKFNDQFAVTAGIRYSKDTVSSFSGLATVNRADVTNPFSPPVFPVGSLAPLNRAATRCIFPSLPFGTPQPPACQLNTKVSSDAPTWVIDLEYTPNNDTLIYAKYGRGYRQGGLQPRSATPSFEPESIDTYEIGAKLSFNGGGVSGLFNIAGFYNKLTNQQLQASYRLGGNFYQSLLNIGKSRVYGFEVDANIKAGAFKLDAGVAYLNTKIIETADAAALKAQIFAATGVNIADSDIGTIPASGTWLPVTPQWRVTITPSVDLPIPENLGKLTLSGTMVHTGVSLKASPDGYVTPGAGLNLNEAVTLFNANLNWRGVGGSPIDLGLFVTNLTNKKYIAAQLAGWNSFGSQTARQGVPRMWGARLRYSFGN